MKSEDKIKALATLDGWNVEPSRAHTRSDGSWGFDAKKPEWNFFHQLPNYLESYDAIIPLIQKQSRAIRASIFIRCGGDGIETPAQLCEALLRATGKWKG